MNNSHHFVLVHGACLGAWCWYKVATLLQSSGHTVTAIDMASCGRDPHRAEDVLKIMDYFKPLTQFMEALPADEKVILVGHSRGGVDIAFAMEHFPTKVAAAVFVSASMPGPNLDLGAISKAFAPYIELADTKFTYGNGKDKPPTSCLVGPKRMATKMYDLSPPEDLTLAGLMVRPTPLCEEFHGGSKVMALTEQNYGSVRRVYVVSEQDKLMKEEMVRYLIENNPPDEVKVINGSDHMVTASKPAELCSCLQEIAAKYS